MIQRAYKTRLSPTPEQVQLLRHHSDVTRFIYNWGLDRWSEHWDATGQWPTIAGLKTEFRGRLKRQNAGQSEWPWLLGTANWVDDSALRALKAAFQVWADICKGLRPKPIRTRPRRDGRPAGYPRHRSRFRGTMPFSFWNVRPEHVRPDAIRLSVVGWIKLAERGYLPADGVKINCATVSERAGRWFVSLQVEQEIPREEATGTPLGVDVGVTRLATVSDGRTFDNPHALDRLLERKAQLQRALANKERLRQARESKAKRRGEPEAEIRRSRRWQDLKTEIARLDYRISCIRSWHTHQVSSGIVGRGRAPAERPSAIGLERLGAADMVASAGSGKTRRTKADKRRRMLDANMAELLRQLDYKGGWMGSTVVRTPREYPSTRTCSACGWVSPEPIALSVRVFCCPECGLGMDRDLNAAINLKQAAERGLAGESIVPEGALAPESGVKGAGGKRGAASDRPKRLEVE